MENFESFSEFIGAMMVKAQDQSNLVNGQFEAYLKAEEIPYKLQTNYPPYFEIPLNWVDFFLREKIEELGLFCEQTFTGLIVYLDEPNTSWN